MISNGRRTRSLKGQPSPRPNPHLRGAGRERPGPWGRGGGGGWGEETAGNWGVGKKYISKEARWTKVHPTPQPQGQQT